MVTIGEKYVERVEKALVETAILSELRRSGNLSEDELMDRVTSIGGFDEKVDRGFVHNCVKRLQRDGHLEAREGRLSLTPDGREDIRKTEMALCAVTCAEIPGATAPADYLPMRGAATGLGESSGISGPPGF